jgi:hypothetical protein
LSSRFKYLFILILATGVASCQTESELDHQELKEEAVADTVAEKNSLDSTNYTYSWLDKYDYKSSIINNIQIPEGYERRNVEQKTFASWLNHLPLKKDNKVLLFNGEEKYNQGAQFRVIDIDVGTKDLQQCADAVMRLRAEYLYASGQADKIQFNYTNGVKIPFSKWGSGLYPSLKANKVVWVNSSNNKSYKSFRKYIDNIFMYAGTASLEKELLQVDISNIKPGDVFIKGGFPGHAVIVLDVVYSKKNNDKCFMIAQSYMPAQNIHILKNPNSPELSPWYSVKQCGDIVETPEWSFYANQLKRFP